VAEWQRLAFRIPDADYVIIACGAPIDLLPPPTRTIRPAWVDQGYYDKQQDKPAPICVVRVHSFHLFHRHLLL